MIHDPYPYDDVYDDDVYDDDLEDEDEDATGVCKYGGLAPCVDDVCHAIGGCMGWQDYQP